MKALVTGHAGFCGRHLVGQLWDADWDVQGVDVAAPHRRDARDFFRDDHTHFDLVVHCAAVVGGRQTIEGAPLAVAVDLSIDAELFQWALRTRPGRIVYYSSSAVYPISLQRAGAPPLAEDLVDTEHALTLGVPDLSYGWAKLSGEMLCRWAQAEGLRVTVLRPFSGYGEGQDLAYPFPSFIDRARRRADPFDIWGDGTQVRDFIHIDDVVDATLTAVAEGVDGPVNLGWGRATSFNDLAELVCEQAGYQPELRHHLDQPVGVQRRVADPARMLEFYRPTITLEEGIARALP